MPVAAHTNPTRQRGPPSLARRVSVGRYTQVQTALAKTIADVFTEFLADQEARLGPKTHAKYKGIIHLYQSYLESYWPGHDGDYDKITKAGGDLLRHVRPRGRHGG